jgi:hypothetical protein
MKVFIFKCDNQTQDECLKKNLFAAKGRWVNDVEDGDICLLFNYQSEIFYGIWKAIKDKGNLDPEAFGGQYPNQVRVRNVSVNGVGTVPKAVIEELSGENFTPAKPFAVEMPLKVLEKLFENNTARQSLNASDPAESYDDKAKQDGKRKWSFSKKAWPGIVAGLLGSFATMALGIWLTMERREPVFATEPRRALIVNAKYMTDAAINVTHSDGTPVRSDITGVTFYFWNQGNKPIRHSEVYTAIRVGTDDPSVNILELKVVGESRKGVTRFVTSPDEKNQNGQVKSHTVTFNVLEQGDGMTGQIIFEGNPYAQFGIIGSVEGVKSFSDVELFRLKKVIMYALFIAIVFALAGLIWFLLARKPVRGIDLTVLDRATLKRCFLLASLVAVTVVLSGIMAFYMAEASNSKILDYVPPAVVPSNQGV